jgi:hypothetical protein
MAERPPHLPLLLAMTAASLHAHCLGQPTATRPVMRDLSRGELHRFPAVPHRPPGYEPARGVPETSRHRPGPSLEGLPPGPAGRRDGGQMFISFLRGTTSAELVFRPGKVIMNDGGC